MKNRRKSEISPNSPKYRARGFQNSFVALPVPINPMLGKGILMLSPIGKKLVWPYQALGGHLGFWPPGPPGSTFFRGNIIYFQEYTSKKSSTSKKFSLGGGCSHTFFTCWTICNKMQHRGVRNQPKYPFRRKTSDFSSWYLIATTFKSTLLGLVI